MYIYYINTIQSPLIQHRCRHIKISHNNYKNVNISIGVSLLEKRNINYGDHWRRNL